MEKALKSEESMENLKKYLGLLLVVCTVLVMLPEASATRFIVGGNMGWSPNVNYTNWVKGKHFYNGDWLCKHLLVSLI